MPPPCHSSSARVTRLPPCPAQASPPHPCSSLSSHSCCARPTPLHPWMSPPLLWSPWRRSARETCPPCHSRPWCALAMPLPCPPCFEHPTPLPFPPSLPSPPSHPWCARATHLRPCCARAMRPPSLPPCPCPPSCAQAMRPPWLPCCAPAMRLPPSSPPAIRLPSLHPPPRATPLSCPPWNAPGTHVPSHPWRARAKLLLPWCAQAMRPPSLRACSCLSCCEQATRSPCLPWCAPATRLP
ncbi:hypothetical protein T484DRAFT_1957504 [Baffinella frigidus]|nr:hypothetical protein T484DRAFT_1957504 [Cryptophyta sp. CCMP2293]